MILHIVALDEQRGIAKDHAMPPWKLQQDEQYFTEQTLSRGGQVLMGKRTFVEALRYRPLANRTNYVATRDPGAIPGAIVINDLPTFIKSWPEDEDLWIIGGAEIFAQTIDIADELYITEIEGNFGCDRFYPEYRTRFQLKSRSQVYEEHGVRYTFCQYVPKVKTISPA